MYDRQTPANYPIQYSDDAFRFNLAVDDEEVGQSGRSEMISRYNSSRGTLERYSRAVMIKRSLWDVSDVHCLILQWKQRIPEDLSPCLSLEISLNHFDWVIKNDEGSRVVSHRVIPWDTWVLFDVEVQWNNTINSSKPPRTIVHMNGQLVVDDREPNMYPERRERRPLRPLWFVCMAMGSGKD